MPTSYIPSQTHTLSLKYMRYTCIDTLGHWRYQHYNILHMKKKLHPPWVWQGENDNDFESFWCKKFHKHNITLHNTQSFFFSFSKKKRWERRQPDFRLKSFPFVMHITNDVIIIIWHFFIFLSILFYFHLSRISVSVSMSVWYQRKEEGEKKRVVWYGYHSISSSPF